MQVVAERYKEDPENKELEVRVREITWEQWCDFYNYCADNFGSSFQLEQSINFISGVASDAKKKNRMTIYFIDGKKQLKDEKIYKRTILESIRGGYKYSLSEELPIDTFNSTASFARIRLRASYLPDIAREWRIDFTFVQEVPNTQMSSLPGIRNKMFPEGKKIKKDDFLEFIQNLGNPEDTQFRYELELEHIGSKENIDVEELKNGVNAITAILNPDATRMQEMYELASLFPKLERVPKSLKQFTNQPIALAYKDYNEIILPNISNYYLSDKADGERALLYIDPEKEEIKLVRSRSVSDISDLIKNFKKAKKGITILDTEVLSSLDKKSNETIDKIYIFDIMMLENVDMTKVAFSEREGKFEEVAAWFNPLTEKKIQIRLSENYPEEIKKIYDRRTRVYPVDGLIFTPADGEYFDMSVYKWKPPEQSTIDFLIVKPSANILGKKPYIVEAGEEIYFLLCGIRYQIFNTLRLTYFPGYEKTFEDLKISLRENYFPIQFSPSENPLAYIWKTNKLKDPENYHGHVGEFKYDVEKSNWILTKMRPDKDVNVREGTAYGNDFKVAEEMYQQFFTPFTLEMLTEKQSEKAPSEGYFAQEKLDMYKPTTKFNNFVKAQLIRQLENSLFAIDLACGKGQDLFTYIGFGIKNLLFVDRDSEAIAELNRRKYEGMDKNELYIYGRRPKSPPNIYTKTLDLDNSSKDIVQKLRDIPLPKNGVDGIVMNLAIHYIIDDQESLNNLMVLVDSLLKPGGVFIFTCFHGERVFRLLEELDFEETYDIIEEDVLKYSIKKLYKSDKFSDYGQKIGVIHPFSQGKYYEENLVNIDNLISKFENKKYEVRQNASFANWINKFEAFNPKISGELKEADYKYIGLYQYISLWKPSI